MTEKALLDLAGKTIYGRGLDYFEGELVSDLRRINHKLRATVSGSHDYDVALWADARGLDYQCSCPMGEDGECCKHVVATGLAWLAQVREEHKDKRNFMQRIDKVIAAADRRC